MARMFNMAQDWTYDLFVEDAGLYEATPRKGVHPSKDASDRERFMVWFKNLVRDFKAEWSQHCPHNYNSRHGWIGDAFERRLSNTLFSDLYKDTYGQRPHLDYWFYIQAVGLTHSDDTARTFCATPTEDAITRARQTRKALI